MENILTGYLEKVGNGGSANGLNLVGDGNFGKPNSKRRSRRNKDLGLAGEPDMECGGKGGDGIVYIFFPKC